LTFKWNKFKEPPGDFYSLLALRLECKRNLSHLEGKGRRKGKKKEGKKERINVFNFVRKVS
jgi:hypothetical protein